MNVAAARTATIAVDLDTFPATNSAEWYAEVLPLREEYFRLANKYSLKHGGYNWRAYLAHDLEVRFQKARTPPEREAAQGCPARRPQVRGPTDLA